eukprot:m.102079 g.102079  ORF g.102079 m.102079 type:complete len:169 (+) comp10423_c0_seq1:1962-2468(+)
MKTSLTSKFESDIKDLKSAHEMTLQNQKDELDAEITKLKEQLASQQREHDTVVTNLTEAHTTALRDKTTEHDAALAAADERLAATRDEHRSRMEKLQIELSETVEKLKAEAVARETEAREKHEKQLLDMQVCHCICGVCCACGYKFIHCHSSCPTSFIQLVDFNVSMH